MADLAAQILAYAYGSKVQAVALMENLIDGLIREHAQVGLYRSISASSHASACCPASG